MSPADRVPSRCPDADRGVHVIFGCFHWPSPCSCRCACGKTLDEIDRERQDAHEANLMGWP